MTRKTEDGKAVDRRRRDFLKLAATGAPAIAVVAASAGGAEAAAPGPASDRMQDTAHTRAYYDSARF